MGRSAPRAPGPRRADDRRIAMASVVLAGAFLALAAVAARRRPAGGRPGCPVAAAPPRAGRGSDDGDRRRDAVLRRGARGRASGVGPRPSGRRRADRRGCAARQRPRRGAVRGVGGRRSAALVFLAGVAAIAVATRQAGRAGLMVRRPIVSLGYHAALANLAVGASLGTLAAIGATPVLERWAMLRPAHAWANLVGFVSVVIVATLLHFLPTVLGTRIVPRRATVVAVLAPALGVPLVVAALVLGLPVVAAGGAVVVARRRDRARGRGGRHGPGARPMDDRSGLAPRRGGRARRGRGVVRRRHRARDRAPRRVRDRRRAGRLVDAARRRAARRRLGRPGAHRLVDAPAAVDRPRRSAGARPPAHGARPVGGPAAGVRSTSARRCSPSGGRPAPRSSPAPASPSSRPPCSRASPSARRRSAPAR